ncbi:MAG TPA: hypothetical protein VLE22_28045 [Bryobacteraceae bacterium]|nr:hypothetical protein [Bryobacteraceae bacterium]
MMTRRLWQSIVQTLVRVIVLVVAQSSLFGQCSMCRAAAAAQGPEAAKALNEAILILLLPAVALFCGAFILAMRGNRSSDPDESRREGAPGSWPQ